MPFRRWYFASNQSGVEHNFDLIHVAVASAKKNTSLQPFFLVEDTDYTHNQLDKLATLAEAGVTIIRHDAEIFDEIRIIFGRSRSAPFNGHWLRTDIPVLEKEHDIVLYTDYDVMFRREVIGSLPDPIFLSCGPEQGRDDWRYFNSGVMVMNIPNLKATRHILFDTVRSTIESTQPHNDQSILNICYKNRYDKLPIEWNWKPYWGFSEDAKIVHFHGPKPGVIKAMLDGKNFEDMPIYHEMHNRSPEGYAMYCEEFAYYLRMQL